MQKGASQTDRPSDTGTFHTAPLLCLPLPASSRHCGCGSSTISCDYEPPVGLALGRWTDQVRLGAGCAKGHMSDPPRAVFKCAEANRRRLAAGCRELAQPLQAGGPHSDGEEAGGGFLHQRSRRAKLPCERRDPHMRGDPSPSRRSLGRRLGAGRADSQRGLAIPTADSAAARRLPGSHDPSRHGPPLVQTFLTTF